MMIENENNGLELEEPINENEQENLEETQVSEEAQEGAEVNEEGEEGQEDHEEEQEKEEEPKKLLKDLIAENPEYQEEFNSMISYRLNRNKKAENKGKVAIDMFKQLTGAKDEEETYEFMKQYAKENNLEIKEEQQINDERVNKIVAEHDAEELFSKGVFFAEEEANRLANIKRNKAEDALFNALCIKLTENNNLKQLKEKGIDTSILDNNEFKKFASMFNKNTSLADIYYIYQKQNPTKIDKGPINKTTKVGAAKEKEAKTVKDFYSKEESEKFTKKYLNEHPDVREAIINSMPRW